MFETHAPVNAVTSANLYPAAADGRVRESPEKDRCFKGGPSPAGADDCRTNQSVRTRIS
jgi:hypothetical protein